MEFNEAVKLGRPRLLFIASDDHVDNPADLETDDDKRTKLEAFKERAKLMDPRAHCGGVQSVYEQLSSKEELAKKVATAIGRQSRDLPTDSVPPATQAKTVRVLAEALAQEAGRREISEDALITLAQRIAANVEDIDPLDPLGWSGCGHAALLNGLRAAIRNK